MQRNAPSLPFKWYFLSFASALGLAFVLMAVFEIRVLNLPDPKTEIARRSVVAPKLQVQAESLKPALDKKPPEDEKKPNPPRKRSTTHLWDLIMTPFLLDLVSMIVGSTALAGLGTIVFRWTRRKG